MNFSNGRVILIACLTCILGFSYTGECALPFGVFPLLTSGWYYKPNPAESVVLGLIVVKVLAIRLAAITGLLPIPYHLNDIFSKNLWKRSSRGHYKFTNLTTPLSAQNFNVSDMNGNHGKNDTTDPGLSAIYRVLLGLSRVDSSDCFLKALCFISRRVKVGNGSIDDTQIISTLRYLNSVEKLEQKPTNGTPITYVFEKALLHGMKGNTSSCESEYASCPLNMSMTLDFESIVSNIFEIRSV